MAVIAGLSLAGMKGTGPGGRIGKADVERALRDRDRPRRAVASFRGVEPAAAPPTLDARGPFEDLAPSASRRITASRLSLSKQSVPHFYLEIECRLDALNETRARIREADATASITITDCIVRATAMALKRVPLANSAWTGTRLRVYESVDIAIERARRGELVPEEYTGATFTISNLGMFGVASMYAIVNPPQAAILGVGAAVEKPIVQNGSLAVGTVVTCTLSGDHRAIDGATGAELLAEIKRLLENPWLLAI
jgi:pyruvate dehydrogenase E2 component (dihydrolipoamide acetyltransferase)